MRSRRHSRPSGPSRRRRRLRISRQGSCAGSARSLPRAVRFGVTFGIDIRWAGVFVAALLVVLLSAPLLLRRQPLAPATKTAPIPAHLYEETPAEPNAPEDKPAERRLERAAPPRAAPAPAAPPAAAKDEAAANIASAAPPAAAARPEAPADEEKRRVGLAPPSRQKVAAPRMAVEPPGGEAGAGTAVDLAAPAPRMFVLAADGEGTPPAVVTGLDASRLTVLRGREFVLLVEADGRVRSVAVPGGSELPGSEADVLRAILFAPGNRPRRLSVRIE